MEQKVEGDPVTVVADVPPVRYFAAQSPEAEAEAIQAVKDRRSLIHNCIIERGVEFDWDETEQRIRIKRQED